MKLGIAITLSVLVVVCSFSLGFYFGKPKHEPEPEYPHFEYREIYEHTHEGGRRYEGRERGLIRFNTPVWGKDFDFQYDTQGTHTHKHTESDITITHGHWRLNEPDTDPIPVANNPYTHIHEGWGKAFDYDFGRVLDESREPPYEMVHSHLDADNKKRTHRHRDLYMGVDHDHSRLNTKSKSRNWRRDPDGDWVHDHFYKITDITRTVLYITHSHP